MSRIPIDFNINSSYNKNQSNLGLSLKMEMFQEDYDNLNMYNYIPQLSFKPLSIRENYSGNYNNYVETTLYHILFIRNLPFDLILSKKPKIDITMSQNKKLLLLDLDETLIHADFSGEFKDQTKRKYDAIISFTSDNDNISKIKQETFSVGIFIRDGVKQFIKWASKYFDIGIFTASVKEYADAVINYIDPSKLIKYRFYRNQCIEIIPGVVVKDLRIFKNINQKDIIMVDNNMYSFSNQLSNGILVNSYFGEKQNEDLKDLAAYLYEQILNANDIRKINKETFQFDKIFNICKNNYIKNNNNII